MSHRLLRLLTNLSLVMASAVIVHRTISHPGAASDLNNAQAGTGG